MKVVLLHLDDEQVLFYIEEEDKDRLARDDAERSGGVFAFAETQYERFQRMLKESNSAVGQRMKSVWHWLQRRTDPQEALLRSLRRSASVELLYPGNMGEREAFDHWRHFLAAKDRHHTLWVVLNTLFSPLTILLAPLPGPNIIGYWFVYRAFCHLLALLGVRRGRNKLSSMRLTREPLLDGKWQAADEDGIKYLSEQLGLKGLGRYISRSAKFAVTQNRGGLAEESPNT